MTEDEAKTKWCPFTRSGMTANERTDTREPGSVGPNAARCIASACMAWRWQTKPLEGKASYSEVIDHPTMPGLKTDRRVPATETIIGDGFCGLAGAPQ